MPYEYTPPKYAQVIEELRRRIESGEYPPGSLLPSEHQLSDEFQIARPTVVRALRVLRQDGWIDTQQGKGSFVRGRPALASLASQRTGEEALNREESREAGELVEATLTPPPPRVAALLGQAGGGEVLARRLVTRQDGEASELVTWWVPAALAEGTDLAGDEPLHGGVRGHLSRRKGIRVDHVLEQVTARHPTPPEVKLLGVGRSAAMLAMYVAARDASGEPVLVLEVVMPGDRHELEDAYQVG
jgi:DNA-binding GntR family transcriptional regulator